MQTHPSNITPATALPIDPATLLLANTITPRDTAALLNRSIVTLERWRRLRVGPPFLRVCGRVLYRTADIAAWLDAQRQDPETAAAGGQP